MIPIYEIRYECGNEEARGRKRKGGRGTVDGDTYIRRTDKVGVDLPAEAVELIVEQAKRDPDASVRQLGFSKSGGL